MEIVHAMLSSVLSILNIEFTIWGHALTLWKVFGFSFISIVMSRFVWEVIDNE